MNCIENINYELYDLYIETCLYQIDKLYDEYKHNSHILALESVYNGHSITEYLLIQEAAKEKRDNKILAFLKKIVDAVKTFFIKIRNNITALLESSKQKKILKELDAKIKVDPKVKDITITYKDHSDDVKKINERLKKNDNIFKKLVSLIKRENTTPAEHKKTLGDLVEDDWNNSILTISGKARVVKVGNAQVILAKLSNDCKAELQASEKVLERKYKLTLSCIADLNSRLVKYTKMNDTQNMRDIQEKIALAEEQRRLLIKLLGEESELLKKKANGLHKSITSITNQMNTQLRLKEYDGHTNKHSHNIRYRDVTGQTVANNVVGTGVGIAMAPITGPIAAAAGGVVTSVLRR